MPTDQRIGYGGVAQVFHWAIAALVIGIIALGFYMEDLPLGPQKFELYQIHKSLGLTVLGLVVLRVLWRLFNPPPPLPEDLGGLEKRAAKASHLLLYVLLFAQPAVGFLQSNAANFPVVYWGFLPLPALIGPNEAIADDLLTLHAALGILFATLVIVHSIAALRHHFLLRDDVLRRMLPGGAAGR